MILNTKEESESIYIYDIYNMFTLKSSYHKIHIMRVCRVDRCKIVIVKSSSKMCPCVH